MSNIKFVCYEFTLSFLKLILNKQDGRSMLCSSEYGDEYSDCIAFREFVHSLTISSILRKNSLPNGLFRDLIKLHSSLQCVTWLTNSIQQSSSWEDNRPSASSIFYGIRMFIFVFARAQHLSLSWARPIQFLHPSHISTIYFNIILSYTPGFSKWESHGRTPYSWY